MKHSNLIERNEDCCHIKINLSSWRVTGMRQSKETSQLIDYETAWLWQNSDTYADQLNRWWAKIWLEWWNDTCRRWTRKQWLLSFPHVSVNVTTTPTKLRSELGLNHPTITSLCAQLCSLTYSDMLNESNDVQDWLIDCNPERNQLIDPEWKSWMSSTTNVNANKWWARVGLVIYARNKSERGLLSSSNLLSARRRRRLRNI